MSSVSEQEKTGEPKITVDAVYEHGTFRILQPQNVQLSEGQKVRLLIEPALSPEEMTSLAASVYEGLSEEEINAVERIALDRSNFFDAPTQP